MDGLGGRRVSYFAGNYPAEPRVIKADHVIALLLARNCNSSQKQVKAVVSSLLFINLLFGCICAFFLPLLLHPPPLSPIPADQD